MGCLIALDFGEKRTGIAHSDPFQMIATGITTLTPNETLVFLEKYVLKNEETNKKYIYIYIYICVYIYTYTYIYIYIYYKKVMHMT